MEKNKIIATVIGVFILIAMVVGATYAYFTMTSDSQFDTVTGLTTTPAIGSVALSSGQDLRLYLTRNQMMNSNQGTYYATGSEEEAILSTATATGAGVFKCSYEIEVTFGGTVVDALKKGESILYVEGNPYDVSDYRENGVIVRGTISNVTQGNNGYIKGNMSFTNTNENQEHLIDGTISASINMKSFSCEAEEDMNLIVHVSTDGVENTVPTTLGYNKVVTCNNGTMPLYNHKYNRIEFDGDFTYNCNLAFTKDTNTYPTINSVVQNASEIVNIEFTGDIETAGYRYQGQNPNNYVWFNNELWRIIGSIPVCLEASCGTNTTNLVKIIRNESIGALSGTPDVMDVILNEYYYGAKNATGITVCSGKCNYLDKGIKKNSYYDNMIANVYWNNGVLPTIDDEAYFVYIEELSDQTHQSKIGLMAPSDYGFAHIDYNVGLRICDYDMAASYIWLYSQGTEKIFANAGSESYYISDIGSVVQDVATIEAHIRPALYLKAGTYVTGGTGTPTDPYVLGI